MPAIDMISLLAAVWFAGVVAGYAVARLDGISRYLYNSSANNLQLEMRQPGFFTKNRAAAPAEAIKAAKIDIDTRKVVTEINTKGLEPASPAELGTTTTTEDTITKSVSRLSQLKGK
jgi:hypothetical protein